MVDGLAGRFHAQLVGVHVHGGQLRAGDAGEQRVIEGHDGKVFRDAQPQLAAELFQHHGKESSLTGMAVGRSGAVNRAFSVSS